MVKWRSVNALEVTFPKEVEAGSRSQHKDTIWGMRTTAAGLLRFVGFWNFLGNLENVKLALSKKNADFLEH